LTKIIKKRIKKEKRFSKIKNVKFENYLKIKKALNKEIYVKKK